MQTTNGARPLCGVFGSRELSKTSVPGGPEQEAQLPEERQFGQKTRWVQHG